MLTSTPIRADILPTRGLQKRNADDPRSPMPFATTSDNVRLYYEEAGSGTPILFIHEFAGDHRNWEPQMRYFARRHRCITYSCRGYTPSDIPSDPKAYS